MIRALLCLACWCLALWLAPQLGPQSSGLLRAGWALLMVVATLTLMSLLKPLTLEGNS